MVLSYMKSEPGNRCYLVILMISYRIPAEIR